MNRSKIFKVTRNGMCLAALLTATCCFAQTDPGPRGGAPGAGSPLGGLHLGNWIFSITTECRSLFRWRAWPMDSGRGSI